jgi:DNA invertase Pin-like site-specific DNA recombinase
MHPTPETQPLSLAQLPSWRSCVKRKTRRIASLAPKVFFVAVARSSTALTLKPPHVSGVAVVELLRVSTQEQAAETRAGLARQKEVNRRTIQAKGLNCIETVELHVSGTVAPSHPEMLRVFSMISNGTIKGVVCSDLDRLFRPDQPSSYATLQIFQDMGAKIYAGDVEYDLTTSNGLLQSAIRSAISGFELSLIKERMIGAKEARRRAGKCPSNRLTLPLGVGYDRATDAWHYTPEIAKVKLLFQMFDEQGIRNYSELGRHVGLGNAGVKVVLRNPIYTGWRVIDKKRGGTKRTSKSGKMYRVKVARAEEDVIRVKVLEPIISEECFERVQREMEQTRFNFVTKYRSNDRVNLGTGLAVCGVCGESLFAVSGKKDKGAGPKPGFYQCKANYYLYRKRLGGCKQRHLRNDHLDQAIVELGRQVLTNTQTLARILESSARKTNEVIKPFCAVVDPSQQVADLGRRDRRLLDAYEAGAITIDELKAKREAIRREKAALEKAAAPKTAPTKDEFLKTARLVVKAAHRFGSLTDKHQQKAILSELLQEVHVRQNQISSLKFRAAAIAGPGDVGATETILLPKPIWVGPPPDDLPPQHKRCIKCSEVKPIREFYRGLNRCNPCRIAADRERHARRRAKNKS